eukprot:CAMPEP_0116554342 /NCGR_PEP_ID=MMETSP0397-20121206/7541_1 /TAXON_ID=216820 /ORGANISM="Cyclophora tenuis, Strain ECT3854" /LENGTH=155 /DNA_ID=CAMNT_0004079497 /DNA_START=8 /DNA_END=475 /DNA_ORIENTATION=-
MPYGRRDEGFGSLGAFTQGMNPLGPAIMEVRDQQAGDKVMTWPLTFAAPGESSARFVTEASQKSKDFAQWSECEVVSRPEQVIAVREFADASMEPVVRRADRELRQALIRDGIRVNSSSSSSTDSVLFAQYDAIFSMGKRRGEAWIVLDEDMHCW